HPDSVAASVLSRVDIVAAMGDDPATTIAGFCRAIGDSVPKIRAPSTAYGEAVLWLRSSSAAPFVLKIQPGVADRRRHRRKYAEGELPPERSFYFRGPHKRLNLRAQNLVLFMQVADGVDDETWSYHLRQGDYSTWLRTAIKDEALASEIQNLERNSNLTPADS